MCRSCSFKYVNDEEQLISCKKCIKKMKKYKERYYNALLYFQKYKTPVIKIKRKTKISFKRDRRMKTHKRARGAR